MITEYNKETIKNIQMAKRCEDHPKVDGYPTFNRCGHTTIDLSHLKSEEDEYQHTLSVKLPNGRFATLCFMQLGDNQICIDTKFHGEGSTRVMNFAKGKIPTELYGVELLAIINELT